MCAPALRHPALAAIAIIAALCFALPTRAAVFDGTGRVEVTDSSGALSWNPTANSMTVSCWFKLSVPTGVSLSKNMVILANARRSDASGAFAYLVQFNIATGNVEFTARGTNGALPAQTLVARPYLDQWYHVAVARSGGDFTGYLNGRQQFRVTNDIGSSANTAGAFIGGTPDDTAHLYGEVQEVAIYQSPLSQDVIAGFMFESQPAAHPTIGPLLRGYFKLGGTLNPDLANYAATPPAGTNPATKTGGVTFEEANFAGEQSTFDSRKNGGRDAITPLSGSFPWEHTLFRRPTTGIPFEFKIGYNSGNAYNGLQIPQFSPFDTNGLGPPGSGWSHTFDARVVPSDKFDPLVTNTTLGLLLWDGSLEVWDTTDEVNFSPRHGEYRGELKKVGAGAAAVIEWTTPDRLVYRFQTPFTSAPGESAMRGRLLQIRDLNPTPNTISVDWDRTLGRVLSVTDTAGGVCRFNYDTQNRLESVGYLGPGSANPLWKTSFTYNAQSRLATLALTGPAAHTATPALPTTWGFYYKSPTDATPGLLEKIADPRGYNATTPAYYVVQITYDQYGRVIEEQDALDRRKLTKYDSPEKRQVSHADPAQATLPEAQRKYWIDTFDRKNRVTEKKDPFGNKTLFAYDTAGNVSAITDANGNRTEFTYDARANVLTKTVVPLSETTTWQYNAVAGTAPNTVPLNRATKRIDPPAPLNGLTPVSWETDYEYDAGGNLKKQSDTLGDLVVNTHNARGQLTATKDANGNETSFTYTSEGFVLTKTVPDVDGATRTWNYTTTELGWLTTDKSPLTPAAQFSYDINGHVVTILDPLGRNFQKTYDAIGSLTGESDGMVPARWTLYGYDNAGQRISMTQRDHTAAVPRVWAYGYTLRGDPSFVRDPSLSAPASTVIYDYDIAGRRIKETDANGFFSTVEYDANGNLRLTVDREGRTWEKRYDALNRVTQEIDPEGNTSVTAYDPAGRIATLTNPRGYVSKHEYDGRGRLSRWIDPEGFPWRYTYDGNGNITKITDALNGGYVMTYGPRNERLTERNQDLKTWTYTYDELLRLKTQTDPNGTVRTVVYDNASRMESATFSTGRQAFFSYDNNNNPLEIRRVVSGQTTGTTFTYDAMDRALTVTDAFSQTVAYTYDAANRLKTTVYPGSKALTRGYDPAGRLLTLTDWATPARVSSFTYDKAGRLKTHRYPNGITAALGYDTAGRVTSLDQGPAATPQQIALRYAYDRNGNKTSETKKGTLAWQPGTAAGQVAPFDESYTPTAAGRLVSSTDALNPARNFSYTYDESGSLRRAQSPGATYDFTYDEDNRVTTVGYIAGPTTTNIANRYDALGRRIARTLNGTETRYVLDLAGGMERILADTDGLGTITARYVHGPDGLGYRENANGAIVCYHADALSNIIHLTDAAGATISDYAYSPYGRVLAATGTAVNPYRFVGSQGVMEELPNLYFMRARYYSAEVGIFLSTDPVNNIGPSWRPHAYGYASGNPLRFHDPNGRNPLVLAGAAIGFLVGYTVETARQWGDFLGGGRGFDGNKLAAKSIAGAVEGGIGAATFGGSFLAGGAAGELTEAGIEDIFGDEDYSVEDYVKAARDGAIGGAIDHYLGGLISIGSNGQFYSGAVKGSSASTFAGGVSGSHGVNDAAKGVLASGAVTAIKQGVATNAVQQTKVAAPAPVSTSISAPGSGGSGIVGSSSITIKSGDTLGNLAYQYGTSVSAIMKANPQITNANVIYAGAKLTVPTKK